MWLEDDKRALLLGILHKWIRGVMRTSMGIPLLEFESIITKLRHAFMALPEGQGLLSPCNWVLWGHPAVIYLHHNKALMEAIVDVCTHLHTSSARLTHCRTLVANWPDFISIVDASSYGVGGIVLGENSACPQMVFRLQWPAEITADVVSLMNPEDQLTNSDLDMAGLLILWLCPSSATIRQRSVGFSAWLHAIPGWPRSWFEHWRFG